MSPSAIAPAPRPAPRLISEQDGFRVYETQTVKGPNGQPTRIKLCEEWNEGRWEPFISLVDPLRRAPGS